MPCTSGASPRAACGSERRRFRRRAQRVPDNVAGTLAALAGVAALSWSIPAMVERGIGASMHGVGAWAVTLGWGALIASRVAHPTASFADVARGGAYWALLGALIGIGLTVYVALHDPWRLDLPYARVLSPNGCIAAGPLFARHVDRVALAKLADNSRGRRGRVIEVPLGPTRLVE